ncbi:MAG: HAMP domain-containing histidine kinase [Clostridiales bacterium]|nr:HAMP domain-containing histidine kinase [Clostridiales bacterium]
MEKLKSKSIKIRVLKSFLMVISIMIILLNILIIAFIKNYYYNNTEITLSNQIDVAVLFYNKYFTGSSLKENIYDNVDSFWNQANAEVQIYDEHGNLLMDSIGVDIQGKDNIDVVKVLNGETSYRWIGEEKYYEYKVMALSKPLIINNELIGVIRYVISLENVDNEINNILTVLIVISIIVLVIGGVMSLFLSKSIINPIKHLTKTAEEMANGNLEVRSKITGQDEIGKLSLTLNYMADELSKRNKLKDEFISSVSHELRTPLTAIKGWVITLDSEETDEKTLKMGLKIIEKESYRLINMVEELLDFSRLQNGKATIKCVDTKIKNFESYIEAYMSQRMVTEKKKLIINSKDDKKTIHIDIDKIKQVILNLIDNAFKFTDNDGVIKLTINREEDKLIIIVADNGCGIPEDELPRVKEKFYKGRNAKSQNGIGLSICDEIVKLHNGSMIIESKEGYGTKVIIEIPQNNGGIY